MSCDFVAAADVAFVSEDGIECEGESEVEPGVVTEEDVEGV